MSISKLSIIIPAYNEESTIELILDRVFQVELVSEITKEIIVIDDCSSDSTVALMEKIIAAHPEQDIALHKHEVNKGKGAALHTGIAKATGDYLIIQDADLEYLPSEYNLLIEPVLKGGADVVYGSRFIGGRPHRKLFVWHSIGNKMLTFFCNVFSNLDLTDMETCYKLIRTDLIQNLKLTEKRFGFEPEVTLKLSRNKKVKFFEVGISYYGRTFEEGKKINWKDGFRALYCILKYGLFRV